MSEFVGFEFDIDDDNIIDDVVDISDIQPEFEEIFQNDINQNQLGRRREGADKLGKPFLGKLDKARLIAARSGQLQLGAPPLIPCNKLNSIELQEIATQEFNEAVKRNIIFPLKIVRQFPDGTYEEWKVSDFKYFVRDVGRSQRSRQRKW